MYCEKKEEGAKSIAQQKTADSESEPQNVPKSTVDRDQIEQSRDEGQKDMAAGNLAQKDDNLATKAPKGLPLPSFDDLRPQDRVKASEALSSLNKALLGKYLVCKTIGPAVNTGAIVVSVSHLRDDDDDDDEEEFGEARLALYNYTSVQHLPYKLSYGEILPLGSFLVVKNPLLTESYYWHCENPAEVELVSRKRMETKFPDLVFYADAETTMSGGMIFEMQNLWGRIRRDIIITSFAQLKRLGNLGFVEKRFSDAIRFYNMALDYCADNSEEGIIQSNKCAALLALGCFYAALKCAELALEVDPSNEKYNYRKTKALIGLRKYEEALNFLQDKFDQFPSLGKSKDCKNLLENVKFLCSRKNLGPTESQLISLHTNNVEDDDVAKIPEFTGPLALIPDTDGKGRGLVATEDIHPGQLLICAKAFSLNATPPIQSDATRSMLLQMKQIELEIEDMETVFAKPCEKQAVKSIANKLLFDPQLGPEFYNLTAGADLDHYEPGDARSGNVDMKRINEIVRINAFGSDRRKECTPVEFMGLWILPSYFNHSCSEYNCNWSICGEWMTVKAIAEIKKGEELTLPYKSPIISNEERTNYFSSLGFSCACKLCQLEANELAPVKNERQKILESVGEITPKSSNKEIKMALKQVEKLASLRKDSVALNFPLISPQIVQLCETLFLKNRFDDCISVLGQMFPITSASVRWHDERINIAINLLSCHAMKKDRELTKVWIATVKRLLMEFHGSLELMRVKEAGTVELLQRQLGMDFFQDD